jgi:hypothetical protein
MIFNTHPFFSLGDDEQLIAQTMNFVEEPPPPWYQQWNDMLPKMEDKSKVLPSKYYDHPSTQSTP